MMQGAHQRQSQSDSPRALGSGVAPTRVATAGKRAVKPLSTVGTLDDVHMSPPLIANRRTGKSRCDAFEQFADWKKPSAQPRSFTEGWPPPQPSLGPAILTPMSRSMNFDSTVHIVRHVHRLERRARRPAIAAMVAAPSARRQRAA
jgi:hypothetical protein